MSERVAPCCLLDVASLPLLVLACLLTRHSVSYYAAVLSRCYQGPGGEYVAFMSYQVPPPPQCTGCVAGCTNPSCIKPKGALGSSISSRAPTYMSWTGNASGGAPGQWYDSIVERTDPCPPLPATAPTSTPLYLGQQFAVTAQVIGGRC